MNEVFSRPVRCSSNLHVGIDASNISQGGGLTHLTEMLTAGNPGLFGVSRVTIWTSKAVGATLPPRDWLNIVSPSWVESCSFLRFLWQQFFLPFELKKFKCDVLLSPGGILPEWLSTPTVCICQNMLPFEPLEAVRFGRWNYMRFKMILLKFFQGRSFRKANGIIFLSQYAQKIVLDTIPHISGSTTVIPHGLNVRFLHFPRPQRGVEFYSKDHPFKLLYVSTVMPYKHQDCVAQAVSSLRALGVPIEITFIGGGWDPYAGIFKKLIKKLNAKDYHQHWIEDLPYNQIHEKYHNADAFIFASSCENLPNILIEAMASGLPIACSDRGPMTEILLNYGFYFDPENRKSIIKSISSLIKSANLRQEFAEACYIKSLEYSWEKCAANTFKFITNIARKNIK